MRCRYCHNPDSWGHGAAASSSAKLMEVGELLDKAERFRSYWGEPGADGKPLGGITVSGGEPLLQTDFLLELFGEAQRRKISTCLDTAGQPYTSANPFAQKFTELMSLTDTVMLDIKHTDPEQHKRLTGQPNANIIECARRIDELGVDLWLRHVLVPGWTDSDDNLVAIRHLADSLKHLRKIEVLPYHTMAQFKYEKLGIPYQLEGVPQPTPEQVAHAEQILGCAH